MPRRGPTETTPAESPRAISLERLVRDTPSKPLTALDVSLSRYNAELDSIPPPMQQVSDFEHRRINQVHQSGSWELEALLAQTTERVKEVAARQLADEIERRQVAERDLQRITDEERATAKERRKTWAERGFAVLLLLLGAAIDRVLR